MTGDVLIDLPDIVKEFSGILALGGVRFALGRGEVHAFVGENGAGTSTLVEILTDMFLRGSGRRFGLIDWASVEQRARAMLVAIGADIEPRALIRALSVARQQMVEIARAIPVDADVVIMDELTFALTEREIADLFKVMRLLRSRGAGMVYIGRPTRSPLSSGRWGHEAGCGVLPRGCWPFTWLTAAVPGAGMATWALGLHFETLRESGYIGSLTIECTAPGPDPFRALKDADSLEVVRGYAEKTARWLQAAMMPEGNRSGLGMAACEGAEVQEEGER
jgi:ABC-type Na+ transport system ATPase subunit NatA